MECLGHLDQVAALARQNFRVERTDVLHAHHLDPLFVLLEDVEHLVLCDDVFELRGVGALGHGQMQAVVVAAYVEQMYVARRGCQCSIEITCHIGHTIDVGIESWAGT